jgi:hypothetical protein
LRGTGWNSIIMLSSSGLLFATGVPTERDAVELLNACHGQLPDHPDLGRAFVADQP